MIQFQISNIRTSEFVSDQYETSILKKNSVMSYNNQQMEFLRLYCHYSQEFSPLIKYVLFDHSIILDDQLQSLILITGQNW